MRGDSEGEKPAKVTINDFIVKACAMALREMPEVNCSYVNNMMRHYKTIDINVAVSVADGREAEELARRTHHAAAARRGQDGSAGHQHRDEGTHRQEQSGQAAPRGVRCRSGRGVRA